MSLGDIGKILPSELYTTELVQEMPMTFSFVLTHLYQPLIGVEAVILYQTLFTESQLNEPKNKQTHHGLMSYLGLPLDRIYRARRKLEAIGLLQTYEQYDEDGKLYHYVLHAPHTGKSFFENDFLGHLLYHQLGSERYKQVNSLFAKTEINKQNKRETTAMFEEVFRVAKVKPEDSIIHTENGHAIPIGETPDFDWYEQVLIQRLLPADKILTKKNRKIITQMAAAYHLTDQQIEKAILWAITEENELNVAEFKAACLDMVKSTGNTSLQVTEKPLKQTIIKQEEKSPAKSKEEQLMEIFENISPRQLLEDLADGNQASAQDLKVVSEVMTSQGLNAGVMNVLLHYVLKKTDMKLSKNYLETIASHWARKNVKTVRQAMTLAKSEHKKYQQWKNKSKTTKRNFNSNKKDIVPDWYKNKSQTKRTNVSDNKDREKQASEADELLNQYLKEQANQE